MCYVRTYIIIQLCTIKKSFHKIRTYIVQNTHNHAYTHIQPSMCIAAAACKYICTYEHTYILYIHITHQQCTELLNYFVVVLLFYWLSHNYNCFHFYHHKLLHSLLLNYFHLNCIQSVCLPVGESTHMVPYHLSSMIL